MLNESMINAESLLSLSQTFFLFLAQDLPQFVTETKDKLQVMRNSSKKAMENKVVSCCVFILFIVPVRQLSLSDGGGHQCLFIVCVSEQLRTSSKMYCSVQFSIIILVGYLYIICREIHIV